MEKAVVIRDIEVESQEVLEALLTGHPKRAARLAQTLADDIKAVELSRLYEQYIERDKTITKLRAKSKVLDSQRRSYRKMANQVGRKYLDLGHALKDAVGAAQEEDMAEYMTEFEDGLRNLFDKMPTIFAETE